MEPDRQVEIQIGHMCNNRCVFCVSGQRTGQGLALPLPVEPVLERVRDAREKGHRKITLLGGEPTLQPAFMPVVRECVALGFEEIVIFTNGAKTARGAFIDEIRDTGGNFTWRISIQGATEETHERTTRKDGSFGRILRTLENLKARDARITINMCVVGSNYESVDAFPELLSRYGVRQLHLDLMRPLDAGQRTEEELRAMMPPLTDMAAPLSRMVAGFPDGFDVNIGNLPYCVTPELARWIHHDGEHTDTIAVDGDGLSKPWNKYLVKRRDKIKPASCATCVFDSRCSGVFETYARFHGTDELVPVTHERLVALDPSRRFLALHVRPLVAELEDWDAVERGVEETHLTLRADPEVQVALRGESTAGAAGRYEGLSVHVQGSASDAGVAALTELGKRIERAGHGVVHPVGMDALVELPRSLAARLRRLRGAAPFGALRWLAVRVLEDSRRVELDLAGQSGERATVWLADDGRRSTGGYQVRSGTDASDALVTGLRAVMAALGKVPSAASTLASP